MKYKMLKELPFIGKGEVFSKGCWVGGGWGVDNGTTYYNGGGSAHNGVKTFNEFENKILDELVKDLRGDWIEFVPTSENDVINLYDEKFFKREDVLEYLTFKVSKERG